jgi:hypothetical protein
MTFSKHNLVCRCVTPHPFVYLSGKVLILYSLRHTTKVHAQLGQVSTELSLNKASKQSFSAWCSLGAVAHFNPIQFFSYNLRLDRFHNRRNSIVAKICNSGHVCWEENSPCFEFVCLVYKPPLTDLHTLSHFGQGNDFSSCISLKASLNSSSISSPSAFDSHGNSKIIVFIFRIF